MQNRPALLEDPGHSAVVPNLQHISALQDLVMIARMSQGLLTCNNVKLERKERLKLQRQGEGAIQSRLAERACWSTGHHTHHPSFLTFDRNPVRLLELDAYGGVANLVVVKPVVEWPPVAVLRGVRSDVGE